MQGMLGTPDTKYIYGVYFLYNEGQKHIDLYFCDCSDIAYYSSEHLNPADSCKDHVHFIGNLSDEDISRIKDKITDDFPDIEIPCIASYFPQISNINSNVIFENETHSPNENRAQSVRALANTLCLADALKCHCVEIVGGINIPRNANELLELRYLSYNNDITPAMYKEEKLTRFATSIRETLDQYFATQNHKNEPPLIAIEIEPGSSFLIGNIEDYIWLKYKLYEQVKNDQTKITYPSYVKLNIDVAHAFLAGITVNSIKQFTFQGMESTYDLSGEIAHMHISDHAGHGRRQDILPWGGHASDLQVGEFHFDGDYQPWLEFAVELSNRPQSSFSKAIAIEMEAYNDIDAVILSERRLTRWLKDIFSKYNSAVNRPFTESITNDIQALLTQMSESRSLY